MGGNSAGAVGVLTMLMLTALTGCLGVAEDNSGPEMVTMNVHYEATSGTILERVQNQQTLPLDGVSLSFDFARVTSKAGSMVSFTMDPGDDDEGSNAVTVSANEQAEISYEFLTHGLFTVTLSATDEQNNTGTAQLTVRIDKRIEWTQTNTNEPSVMVVDTLPDCDCPLPNTVALNSTVTNPNDLVPPNTPVTVTWTMVDASEATRASHSEQIAEGQSGVWSHAENNVDAGEWRIEVAQGDNEQESLDVSHEVEILYAVIESEPNPLEPPVEDE